MYRILYIPTGSVVRVYFADDGDHKITHSTIHDALNNKDIEYSCDGLISSAGLDDSYEFNNSKFRTKLLASLFLDNLMNSWLRTSETYTASLNEGIKFSTVTINEFEIIEV